jgi:hypothetical protein
MHQTKSFINSKGKQWKISCNNNKTISAVGEMPHRHSSQSQHQLHLEESISNHSGNP